MCIYIYMYIYIVLYIYIMFAIYIYIYIYIHTYRLLQPIMFYCNISCCIILYGVSWAPTTKGFFLLVVHSREAWQVGITPQSCLDIPDTDTIVRSCLCGAAECCCCNG